MAMMTFRKKLAAFTLRDEAEAHRKAWDTRGRKEKDEKSSRQRRERPKARKVKDVEEAIVAILKGEVVEVPDTRTVNTVLEKLADMAHDAEQKGEKAPNYDLCQISVPGTNLFCADQFTNEEYPDGVPRIEMPQIAGEPVPGSQAAKLPINKKGEVDGTKAFMLHMMDTLRLSVKEELIPAAKLKATQREIIGPKVSGIMRSQTAKDLAKMPIFVSRDGYVVDGHHRWAAVVGHDSKDGNLGDIKISSIVVDAPIAEILFEAKKWAAEFGIKGGAGVKRLGMRWFDGLWMTGTVEGAIKGWETRGNEADPVTVYAEDRGLDPEDVAEIPAAQPLTAEDVPESHRGEAQGLLNHLTQARRIRQHVAPTSERYPRHAPEYDALVKEFLQIHEQHGDIVTAAMKVLRALDQEPVGKARARRIATMYDMLAQHIQNRIDALPRQAR